MTSRSITKLLLRPGAHSTRRAEGSGNKSTAFSKTSIPLSQRTVRVPNSSSNDGWTRVAFGDVVRQVKDVVAPETSGLRRYVAGEHMDTDSLRIRRWGTVGDGYLGPAFHMRFRRGHVLYGSRRTYLRKVAVADFDGITANTTFVLEPKDPNILMPELLPMVMQSEAFAKYSVEQSKGSVNPYVNFSDLAKYQFLLPPVAEQRRRVEVLLATESAIDAFTAAYQSLDHLRWALLRRTF